MQVSQRLLAISELITKANSVICDIGTDHGLLPIFLINNQQAKIVYATDITSNPLLQAKKNIDNYCNYPLNIKLLLSDGLKKIPKDIIFDYVVIAGLGEKTITSILNNDLENIDCYIVCATDNSIKIRNWIKIKNYFVLDEKIIIENNIYYEIILISKKNGVKIVNDFDIIFGPILLIKKSQTFINKWEKQYQYYQKLLLKIPKNHKNFQIFNKHLTIISEVLKNESSGNN